MVVKLISYVKIGIAVSGFLTSLSPGTHSLSAQTVYNFYYRVYLRDKGTVSPSDFTLEKLFSQRAVDRRIRIGSNDPDYRDLPVNKAYLEQITALGLKLHCTSRWMNTALFKTENQIDPNLLLSLPFVSDVRLVKDTGAKGTENDKLDFELNQQELPPFDRPLTMVNALPVHNSGFTGNNTEIAVLDAGFKNADNILSLESVRERNGIIGTYDFVKKNSFVYDYHNHGTAVLSVIAGTITGLISGSAPGADFWLLRTEDPETEFPAEEDYWIAGAEFADSAGADIISSSLGYFNFDDPSMNYKYSDLNGRMAFITRAAGVAVSRGIVVVNSAGNERNSSWIHIIAPADGDSVIAVGAVDGNNIISSFSSAGPSYDRRIKPDIVAQGVSVPVQVETSTVSRSSGTSFSCPVISGMCACVLQAVPNAAPYEIIEAVRSSADRYFHPDSLYGYGIPDFTLVVNKLQEELLLKPTDGPLLFPNPFSGGLKVIFPEPPGQLRIGIFTISGETIFEKDYGEYAGRFLELNNLIFLRQGVYLIRLMTPGKTVTLKAIKTGT